MKLALASDIHGKFSFKWPKADVLILAGDILPNFSFVHSSDAFMQRMFLQETLAPALHTLLDRGAYDHIVMIPGNHDRAFQMDEKECRKILKQIRGSFHLLIDEDAVIDGKIFYGSPWTPWFGGHHWAYNFPDHDENFFRARAHSRICWDKIPDDVEVLITHGPARNILDETSGGEHAGCKWLMERIDKLDKLSLHVCGHIHESYGQLIRRGIIHANVAICTLNYKPTNPVQVVEI